MKDLKPIETVYNGYRFRSRLEARWAVFFDAIGVEYQYEPDGIEFSDGTKYLPDFYLPENDMYIEIKSIGAFLQKGETLENGRENNFKYVIARTEIEEAGKKYALITGTPLDVQDGVKNGAFVWGTFSALIYSLCEKHKDEAEVSSFVRFEHGETVCDYIKKFVRNKTFEMQTRLSAIEKNVVGFMLIHPHFYAYTDKAYESIEFKNKCSSIFRPVVNAVWEFVFDDGEADATEEYDVKKRQEIRDSLSLFNAAVFDMCYEFRNELSVNDLEAFDWYLSEWHKEYESGGKYSLEEILRNHRRQTGGLISVHST